MAGPSKNSRGTNRTNPARGKQNQTAKILIPLGGGTGVYVADPTTGTSRRFAVASEEFGAAIAELAEGGHAARVRDELGQLHAARPEHGWDATLARLERAGALG